jgi:hypothetical protein
VRVQMLGGGGGGGAAAVAAALAQSPPLSPLPLSPLVPDDSSQTTLAHRRERSGGVRGKTGSKKTHPVGIPDRPHIDR